MAAMLMRRRNPALMSALAATCAAVLLAGCSPSQESGGPLPDAAELLGASATTTRALTSAHLDIGVDGKIKSLPIVKLSGDLTNTPATAVKGDATIEFGGSQIEAPFVVVDGVLYANITGGGGYSELGPAAETYDPSVILNPDTGLANMLANFDGATAEAAETINGVETVRVGGKVNADAVNKLLPQLKATEPVSSTAWIARDGDHNLVRARISPDADNSINMTLSAWNVPVTVTKPAN